MGIFHEITRKQFLGSQGVIFRTKIQGWSALNVPPLQAGKDNDG